MTSAFVDKHELRMYWTPATSKEDLVQAIVAMWVANIREWRSTCKTRQEACTKYFEELKSLGRTLFVENETYRAPTRS